MMELMEGYTSAQYPDSLSLLRPEKWPDNQGIKAFLAATEVDSLEQLKTHSFIPPDSMTYCLVPHVLMAQVTASRVWEVLPNIS